MNYIETQIVTKIVTALVEAYPDKHIVVDSDRGYDPEAARFEPAVDTKAVVAEAGEYDEVHIFVDGPDDGKFSEDGDPLTPHGPFVYLIFDNGNGGWDVVADYMSLDPALEPVMDWILKEGD
jgi:hypothetical protein